MAGVNGVPPGHAQLHQPGDMAQQLGFQDDVDHWSELIRQAEAPYGAGPDQGEAVSGPGTER